MLFFGIYKFFLHNSEKILIFAQIFDERTMKRSLFLLLSALFFAACGRRSASESPLADVPVDSLSYHVLMAIADSDRTVFEVQDELYALLDSLQAYVESDQDEEQRIHAKQYALDLSSIFLTEDFCSPDEVRFFVDSLVMRFSDIQSTWYCPTYMREENSDPLRIPLMTQDVVFRDRWEGTEHVICIDYYDAPDYGEILVITLPYDADYLTTIMFNSEGMDNIKDHTFSQEDAFRVVEHEEGGMSLLFGPELIREMLTNDGMFIGYTGKDINENRECLFYDCHLILSRFQEQYTQLQ